MVGHTLYLAALTASRFDPRFRTFKEHLLAVGKARKFVIAACARKLLTVLNAMMRTGTTYRDAIARNTAATQELELPANPGRFSIAKTLQSKTAVSETAVVAKPFCLVCNHTVVKIDLRLEGCATKAQRAYQSINFLETSMIAPSARFYIAQGYAFNYYLLAKEPLKRTVRYGEIKGIIEAFSYQNKDVFTIFPRDEKFEEFKSTFFDFLRSCSVKEEILDVLEGADCFLCIMRWSFSKEADQVMSVTPREEQEKSQIIKYYKSIMVEGKVPIHEFPIEILAIDLSPLFSNEMSSKDMVGLLDAAFSVERIRYHNEDHSLYEVSSLVEGRFKDTIKHSNDVIVMKPSFFGVGVDLNEVFRRLFR
mgnify:FL=1|jgi:hypothetical protein